LRKIKDKVKSFSSWTLSDACDFFNIKEPTKLDPPQLPFLPAKLLRKIRNRVQEDYDTGGPLDRGSEMRRNVTVIAVLLPIIHTFGGSVIQVRYEAPLSSFVAQGRVEFVLYALEDIVMYIVEAKKDDFAQGAAQLMMQLHTADIMNNIEGTRIPLCGAVTNGATWQFFSYDATKPPAERFSRSRLYELDSDPANIAVIAKILMYSFLKTFRDSCHVLDAVWAQQTRPVQPHKFDWNKACEGTFDVIVGDTLEFTHNKTHSVKCSDPALKLLNVEGKTTVEVTIEGRYSFYCPYHSNQKINVYADDPLTEKAKALARFNSLDEIFDGACNAASDAASKVVIDRLSALR